MGRKQKEQHICLRCNQPITEENMTCLRGDTGRPYHHCKECNRKEAHIKRNIKKGTEYIEERIDWHRDQVSLLVEALDRVKEKERGL